MTMKEIIEKCSTLTVCEQRQITEEQGELVFYNKDIEQWNKVFAGIFGPPIKPAGVEPTEDDLQLAKDFGGIFPNQTLFKKDFADISVIAMFWPWQDNIHTTLKVALIA